MMPVKEVIEDNRRVFPVTVIVMVLLCAAMFSMSTQIPNATAVAVIHDVGNLKLVILLDWGRLLFPLQWPINGMAQSVQDNPIHGGVGFIGVVVDQDNYNHVPGSVDIADSFRTYPYSSQDDLTKVSDLTMVVDDGTTQKSVGAFQNTGVGTGDPNDILINQTVWTVKNTDWAILQWTLHNIKGIDLTGVCLGLELPMSQVAGQMRGGVGYDSGDDIDGFDASNGIYWVQDDDGTSFGVGSAVSADPITHYHSVDYNDTYSYDEYKILWENDTWLYERLHAPNATAGAIPGNRTSTVGWNDLTLPAGSSKTLTLVLAMNHTFNSMVSALKDARYYHNYMAAGGFHITEFQDSSSSSQRIEVYNDGELTRDLSTWELRDGAGSLLSGNWVPDPIIAPKEYRYLEVSSGLLDSEGDTINLYDDNSILVDQVAYGQYGIVPDPIGGESSSRVWDPGIQGYSDDWTMTIAGLSAPSFGTQNVVPMVDGDPHIVLNEILYYSSATWERFVELRNIWNSTMDISGYKLVADAIYDIPSPLLITNDIPVFFVNESDSPSLFSSLTSSGDNIYLYNDTGVLLDMVGWSSTHGCIDSSMERVPSGTGTFDGFNDMSSQNAGWHFCRRPSPLSILIEADQKKNANPGDNLSFNLTITNLKDDNDVVDLSCVSSEPNGWIVTFYTGDGTWIPLTDTNGDPFGYLDIGIMKPAGLTLYETVNIIVNLSIPTNPPRFREYTTVGAISSTSSFGYDTALLTTEIAPFIQVNKTASPENIFVTGMGNPDNSKVILNLTGAGVPQLVSKPQDVVLAIDSSLSMSWNDPSGFRIIGAKHYLDNMSAADRAAVVGFGHDHDYNEMAGAWLTQDVLNHTLGFPWEPHHFRNTDALNLSSIKSDVDSLNWSANGTNIEMALQVALQELVPGYTPSGQCLPTGRPFPPDLPGDSDGVQYGNTSHWWIIILLTDGGPSHETDCTIDEVEFAALKGVRIFTIGLGEYQDEIYLNESIAQPTGGRYFFAEKPEDIPSAYESVRTFISRIAGSAIPPPAIQPMVTDIVPSELTVDVASIDPTPVLVGDDGSGNTMIQWEINSIEIGNSWIANYDVSCNDSLIDQDVTYHPFATIDYVNWEGKIVSVPIPNDNISCSVPPRPYITNVSIAPSGVNITWIQVPGADLYELYGGPTQTSLNLDIVDVITTVPVPQTWWVDTTRLTAYPDEYYYVVRAVDTDIIPWVRSNTSNTGGYYSVQFDPGLNTVSLPLQPFVNMTLDTLMSAMGATSISTLDVNDNWQTYTSGPSPLVRIGEGYVVDSPNQSYIFTGQPASMILYSDSFGFDDVTRDDLSASVSFSGDVTISWTPISGADKYYVLRSNTRDGFFTWNYNTFEVTSPPFMDPGGAVLQGELYYLVVPWNSTLGNGSSTYSIGVITKEFNGNDMVGLPLKPTWGDMSADWYCDQIPNALGIVYLEDGIWKAHFKAFPEGVYDTIIECGRGYQLAVYDTSRFSFIGW